MSKLNKMEYWDNLKILWLAPFEWLDLHLEWSRNWSYSIRLFRNTFWLAKACILIRIFNIIFTRGNYMGLNVRNEVKKSPWRNYEKVIII